MVKESKVWTRPVTLITILCISLIVLYRSGDYFMCLPDNTKRLVNIDGKNIEGKNYDLAKEESYGFFDDISESDWIKKTEAIKTTPWFQHPNSPETGMQSPFEWTMFNVHPIFSCPLLVRMGGMADGGKWVCDPIRLANTTDCLVYSIGSNGQYDFEDAVFALLGGKKTCEVHVFDPNPACEREGDIERKNIHFHPWGISSSYRNSERFGDDSYIFHNFREIAEKLGHGDRRIDIFKIDCEGCEWFSYKDIFDTFKNISQFLIEVHPGKLRPSDVKVSEFFLTFKDNGFVPFTKEATTYEVYSGIYEYSFIKLKLNH